MGNSLKITSTISSSPANKSLSSHNENNNTNFYSQQYNMPLPNAYSYYSGWPPYPLSSYSPPPSYLPSQALSYLPLSSHTQFTSTNTSTLDPIASQSTSQIQQFNNNIITKLTEPSIKNFLEELDKNFGKGKYTIYLQKFEEEEITVSQIAEMNPEILLNDFGIEIIGRRLNIIKEAKKYI